MQHLDFTFSSFLLVFDFFLFLVSILLLGFLLYGLQESYFVSSTSAFNLISGSNVFWIRSLFFFFLQQQLFQLFLSYFPLRIEVSEIFSNLSNIHIQKKSAEEAFFLFLIKWYIQQRKLELQECLMKGIYE